MPKHHIIVGDGLTAAEFAITRPCLPGDKITIIGDKVSELGRGVAYAGETEEVPWRYAYLLNSPVRSVDSTFARWISTEWDYLVERMSGRTPDWLRAAKSYVEIGEYASLNAPREIYGEYLHAKTVEKLDAKRRNGIDVEVLSTRARYIQPDLNKLNVKTEDGQHLIADSIDVATGGPANQRIEGDDEENSFPQLFGNERRIAEKLGVISSGGQASHTCKSGKVKSVVCLGAGAAMLDVLRFCQSILPEHEINLTAISTTGKILPALRPGSTFTPAKYEINSTFKTANAFLEKIETCQQQALLAGHNFYETRVGLRLLFAEKNLSDFVPSVTEARKIAKPLFNLFQGTARDCVDDFNRLEESGLSRCLAGRVTKIVQQNDHASVHYIDSGGSSKTVKAKAVVNCAGPGRQNNYDELTASMLRNQWISLCEHSGGILIGDNAQTGITGLRYLGPAVTSVGNNVQQVPFYDAYRLKMFVQNLNKRGAGNRNSI